MWSAQIWFGNKNVFFFDIHGIRNEEENSVVQATISRGKEVCVTLKC